MVKQRKVRKLNGLALSSVNLLNNNFFARTEIEKTKIRNRCSLRQFYLKSIFVGSSSYFQKKRKVSGFRFVIKRGIATIIYVRGGLIGKFCIISGFEFSYGLVGYELVFVFFVIFFLMSFVLFFDFLFSRSKMYLNLRFQIHKKVNSFFVNERFCNLLNGQKIQMLTLFGLFLITEGQENKGVENTSDSLPNTNNSLGNLLNSDESENISVTRPDSPALARLYPLPNHFLVFDSNAWAFIQPAKGDCVSVIRLFLDTFRVNEWKHLATVDSQWNPDMLRKFHNAQTELINTVDPRTNLQIRVNNLKFWNQINLEDGRSQFDSKLKKIAVHICPDPNVSELPDSGAKCIMEFALAGLQDQMKMDRTEVLRYLEDQERNSGTAWQKRRANFILNYLYSSSPYSSDNYVIEVGR